MGEIVKTDGRNGQGVKWSADCYRTVNGQHFVHWMAFIPEGMVDAYRAAGIRCRRFKDDLFIHPEDTRAALKINEEHFPHV